MLIEIRSEAFDPLAELSRYQDASLPTARIGALAVFIGTMRDFNEGSSVHKMTLEHYAGMTERQLQTIVDEARNRWPFDDALVIHRVGELFPADPIVLVAVWSSHRGTAFDACRHILEALKHRAPFWKKESLEQGERWVRTNTDGHAPPPSP
ncbi:MULTISPECIES: molybdenum cofactor biosynthesis protein MoaE [Methylococcus]|jgi:molybdopterin synthase catalytic subunit|uniref:Molybdopterin synthase catalytic subunit n=2 Tax=Methylococcus capsulatus TaxID=414 RepID=Q602K8_METCA|nr:molybdenum cofactor biosynthesis protein MoaE [Methylococcus capsulatus]AAU90870.1 molybdopterin converting factor, subunit 2 [Methylococcus capsulatus str. Bath]QXP89239.1 molybdenum cofactor biosynthesis protein MoaE [Methylococcus capsulatus]CAI8793829.1 molybdopterin synthase catalytic subunit [Methylococcus capsulatus]